MNKVLPLLTLLGMSITAQAQLDLGGKAGLNYHFQSTALGDKAPAGSSEPEAMDGLGFHVGAFAQFGLSDKIFLRPELLYSTRTGTEKVYSSLEVLGITTVLDYESKGTLSYLELPVMLGFRLSDKVSLLAGPALGFLMNNKVVVSGTTSVTTGGQTVTTSLDETTNSTDGLNTTEVAGVVGLGYRADNGLDIGLRYWRGFTTLEENTDLSKTYQNMLQFSVGYAFLRN
ncbi:MAG: PorT family protein [Flavobacteriales bacterium]|nr:PorT family protein [Flavobacteriales bacterium]